MKYTVTILILLFLGISLNVALAQTQLGADILPTSTVGNSVGPISLSADGSRMAIGLPDEDNYKGRVKVYSWQNNAWAQIGTDLIGKADDDEFGAEIALSSDGNRLAVASPFNEDGGSQAGKVQVYAWQNNSWVQLGADLNGATDASFGNKIGLSADGNRLIVGATGSPQSQVLVYEWANNTWSPVGAPITGDPLNLGRWISISGNGSRILVDPFDPFEGAVAQVYEWQNNAWEKLGQTMPIDRQLVISADGSRVAGYKRDFGNPEFLKVFEWANNTWSQVGGNIDFVPNSSFGNALSLSTSGNRMAVGNPTAEGSTSGDTPGEVRMYHWQNSTWKILGTSILGSLNQGFGANVALSADGDRLAAGTSDDDLSVVDRVRVYNYAAFTSTATIAGIPVDVYPNPTSGFVRITGVNPDVVRVTDAQGHLVKAWNIPQQEINLSDLPIGVYFLEIGLDDQYAVKKIIKN